MLFGLTAPFAAALMELMVGVFSAASSTGQLVFLGDYFSAWLTAGGLCLAAAAPA